MVFALRYRLMPRLTFSNPKASPYFPFSTVTRRYMFSTSQTSHKQAGLHHNSTSTFLTANCLYENNASFDVLIVFWRVTLCRLVNSYRRFGGAQCLHLQCHADEVILCDILVKRRWQLSRGLRRLKSSGNRIRIPSRTLTCGHDCHYRSYPPHRHDSPS